MQDETDLGVAATEPSEIMPVMFVGHGLPINAALNNDFAKSLRDIALTIPPPRAIAIMSAHWITPDIHVTSAPHPRQIFDSIEFQQELHEIDYEPPGHPELAEEICNLLRISTIAAKPILRRGLDVSVWGILVHMYPEATILWSKLACRITLTLRTSLRLGKPSHLFGIEESYSWGAVGWYTTCTK